MMGAPVYLKSFTLQYSQQTPAKKTNKRAVYEPNPNNRLRNCFCEVTSVFDPSFNVLIIQATS